MVISRSEAISFLSASSAFKRLEDFFLCHQKAIRQEKTIAVAVSGGSDSLLLCFLLKILCDRHDQKMIALHVNHKLRAESDNEAKWVKEILDSWEIPVKFFEWVHQGLTTRIQEKARDARFTFMTDFCKENRISMLFLGHHSNDQLETFFMRFFHGSGLRGLTGMHEKTPYRGIFLVRPFLSMEKEELLALLKKIHQKFLQDPSNENPLFLRVKWRQILEKFTGQTERRHALTTLSKLSACEEALAFYETKMFSAYVSISSYGYALIKGSFFQDSPPLEISVRILEKALISLFNLSPPLRRERLERCLEKMRSPGFLTTTLGGCLISQKKEDFLITREPALMQSLIISEKIEKRIWDNRFYLDKIVVEKNKKIEIGPVTKDDLSFLKSEMVDIPPLSNKVLLTLPAIKADRRLLSVPHLNYNPDLMALKFMGNPTT